MKNKRTVPARPKRKNFKDESGKRYGKLRVLRFSHFDSEHCAHFVCECDCGKQKTYWGFRLRCGEGKHCGCESTRPGGLPLHGMCETPEYRAWHNIKTRCFNRKAQNYDKYGGRGITIFEGWRTDFLAFFKAVGKRPSPELSLDRIDPDKNYEPGNVRWGTKYMQRMNQRRVWEEVNAEEEAAYWGDTQVIDTQAHLNPSVPAEDLDF